MREDCSHSERHQKYATEYGHYRRSERQSQDRRPASHVPLLALAEHFPAVGDCAQVDEIRQEKKGHGEKCKD